MRRIVDEYGRRFPECIVYLDSYKKVDDGVVDAYVDFRLKTDLDKFLGIMNLPKVKATYIELKSLKTSKRLIHGCYYKLNLELLMPFEASMEQNSLLIGWHFDLSNMATPKGNAEEMLQSHEPLDPEEMSVWSIPGDVNFSVDAQDNGRLFVMNVGQANWNELRNGNRVEVVYDAGAELHASAEEVGRIINNRKHDLEQSKPVLVISHWDTDHIHCLRFLTDQDIKECFSMLICVDKLKSITANDILDRFKKALGAKKVFCLPVPERTDGITMHQWRRCGSVAFYQGERSRNINYCGLVMFVQGQKASANYTGDCRLIQADSVYQQEFKQGINTPGHILVAPHHGGDSGASFRLYGAHCDCVIISVGAGNQYGHPHEEMLTYLNSLGPVERTDKIADIGILKAL